MNISKEQFTELAKEHLIALESYCVNKKGQQVLEIFGIEKLYEAINVIQCCTQLKDKKENNIEIKTLGDLKRAYPEGKLHTVNSYGKIINYSVDGEIVYTRHL